MTTAETPATEPRPKKLRRPSNPLATPSQAMVDARPKTQQHAQRPYLLESSVVEDDLKRQRAAALSEIEAIEAEILSITERANNDIVSIQQRADAEVSARKVRAEDLEKIVAMADRALSPAAAPNRGLADQPAAAPEDSQP